MISPPSGTSVADVWNAIKAGAPTHVRMVFGYDMPEADQVIVDDRDIDVRAGLTVTDMLNGETDLTFGKAVSKQLTTNILITEHTAYLPWTNEFRLDMGVEMNGSTLWTTIGYFSGSRPNNISTQQTVEFTAYDRMSAFDQLADTFWSGLDFTTPLSLEDIYDALCTYCGVTNVSGDELSASFSRTYSAAPMDLTGYTCRDVLAWIAEAVGCYARITSDGYCKLLWYGDVTSHVITRNEEFHVEHADLYSGMIWNEFDEYTWNEAEVFTWNEVEGYYGATYGVRGVKVKQTNLGMDIDYPTTQPWNVYTIMDNPFLQIEDMVTDPITYVKPIYDRLIAFGGQLPMNADCVGCWCIEAGDIITIHVADEEIHLPVFCKTMRWNGALRDEYETTGEKFRKVINDSQKQRVINNRNIKLYVDGNYYGIVNGIDIDENGVTITGSKINIISGSSIDNYGNIDVENGAKIDIKSGGDIDIESGGDINVKGSGNLNIKNGGNATIEGGGHFTVNQTGDITVKNGGKLKVETGGNIDINGSGNLKLTGSTVSIKSGSTFEVDATNFKLNSTNKEMVAGNFTFNDSGMRYLLDSNPIRYYGMRGLENTSSTPSNIVCGTRIVPTFTSLSAHLSWSYQIFTVYLLNNVVQSKGTISFAYDSDTGAWTFMPDWAPGASAITCNLGRVSHPFTRIYLKEIALENAYDRLKVGIWSANNYVAIGSAEVSCRDKRTSAATTAGWLGTSDYKWLAAYIQTVYCTNCYESSSRYIKHDIRLLPSYGEKIDKLQPVSFVYDDDETERDRVGLIYEDTVDVLPEICSNDEEQKAIDYVKLVPILLKEIQDLRKRVSDLEDKLNEREV